VHGVEEVDAVGGEEALFELLPLARDPPAEGVFGFGDAGLVVDDVVAGWSP